MIEINIALDLLLQREPFYTDVEDLFTLAHNKKIELFIAAHSFVIIGYVAARSTIAVCFNGTKKPKPLDPGLPMTSL